jgi:signal recognition particle receptor subunit beta
MLGYVVLIDADRPESVQEAVTILAAFRKMAPVPFVVAMNRSSSVDPAAEAGLRDVLELDPSVPVVACDATDKASVKLVLLSLLHTVLESLDREPALPA